MNVLLWQRVFDEVDDFHDVFEIGCFAVWAEKLPPCSEVCANRLRLRALRFSHRLFWNGYISLC